MVSLCGLVPGQMQQDTTGRHGVDLSTSGPFTIRQEVDFNASPARVYKALLDSKQFSEFTAQGGGPFSAHSAKIDRKQGGAFSLFDGYITGRNIELVTNQRIVQAWHDKEWPAGVYSLVRFELTSNGTGTHLVLDQTGFPPRSHDHLAAGWKTNYWDPIASYLDKKK
ncbi:MAG TPA: SRPBCC domain-containing protein [Bacteroidota bacterium]|nr:SRPBCC domain-containing protein [Bacteroidota bacterium]